MSATLDHVILVDRNDVSIGIAEKLSAHIDAKLHRAFSIFVFDSRGRVLLQRRALAKYHSAGLWSNTCCSHPRPDESTMAAARRRLEEEMGMRCSLSAAFSFVYRADVGHGLVEHEYDHVFFGRCEAIPCPDPLEVAEWKWVSAEKLSSELRTHPGNYTYWLRIAWKEILTRGLLPAALQPQLVQV